MKVTTLITVLPLILCFCFVSSVKSASINEVSLIINERLMVEIDTDTFNPGESSARQEYSVDLFNGKDASGENLEKISLFVDSKEPEKITEIKANNLTLLSKKPIAATGENIGEDENAGLTLITEKEESTNIPLKVIREADSIYFEKTKKQTIGLRVTQNSSTIEELSVSISLTGEWINDKAEIKFISASREHFQNLFQGAEEERVEFSVANPAKDEDYYFTVQVEVTPLQGQVTYLPNVWVGAITEKKDLEQSQGNFLEKETGFAFIKVESAKELLFISETMKELVVSISGVSTQERLDLKTPTLSLPKEVTPEQTSKTDKLPNINWEFIGVSFGILSALASVTFAWWKRKKKHKIINQHAKKIEAIFLNSKKAKSEKGNLLKQMKRDFLEEVAQGNISEATYTILDRKIGDCLEELEKIG